MPATIVITRQQYDEAVAKLPEARVYPEPWIEVLVNAASLLSSLKFSNHPGTEDWPMAVYFDKIQLTSPRLGLNPKEFYWQLSPGYRILR